MSEGFGAEQVRSLLAEARIRPTGVGDGTLFGEPVVVFAQIPTSPEEGFRHAWARPDGRIVARAQEHLVAGPGVDEASWRELVDHQKTDLVTVTAPNGEALLRVSHLKHWKSKAAVSDGHGRQIGMIRQKSLTFKPAFALDGDGPSYGRVRADGPRMLGFDLLDRGGNAYGRMTKVGSKLYGVRQYHGGMAAGLPPTTAKVLGAFVVQFFRRPDHPQLAAAIPLVVDLSMAMGSSLAKLDKRAPGPPG